MLEYPVVLEPAEEGGYVVRFPDVPEAITQGEDAEEALMRAVDALETALEFYVGHRRSLPVPSKAKAGPVVRPRALTCAKLGVYRTMLERHVGKAELARRLHWHLPQVDRLLDLGHASRVDQIEAAYCLSSRPTSSTSWRRSRIPTMSPYGGAWPSSSPAEPSRSIRPPAGPSPTGKPTPSATTALGAP